MTTGDSTQIDRSSASVRAMFGSIANRYDLTNTVLSLGIHHLWRRALMRRLPDGDRLTILDLCTGTGDLAALMGERGYRVIGADFCLPMLQAGSEKVPDDTLLVQGDALALPFAESCFDAVTVAFGVRNFADLNQGLREIARVLKPGGKALVLEFGQPENVFWQQLFGLYSKCVMPLVGGLLTGNQEAYRYLPETSRSFPCGADFEALLMSCGFLDGDRKPLSGGVAYLYTASI